MALAVLIAVVLILGLAALLMEWQLIQHLVDMP